MLTELLIGMAVLTGLSGEALPRVPTGAGAFTTTSFDVSSWPEAPSDRASGEDASGDGTSDGGRTGDAKPDGDTSGKSKPGDTKPAETKPGETKPDSGKPIAADPGTEGTPPKDAPDLPKMVRAKDATIESARTAALEWVRTSRTEAEKIDRTTAAHPTEPQPSLAPRWTAMERALLELIASDGHVLGAKVKLFHDSADGAETALAALVLVLQPGQDPETVGRRNDAAALAAQMAQAQKALASHERLATPDVVEAREKDRREQALRKKQQDDANQVARQAQRKAEQETKRDNAARSRAAQSVGEAVYQIWAKERAISASSHWHARQVIKTLHEQLLELYRSPSAAGVALVREAFQRVDGVFNGMINDGGRRPRERDALGNVQRMFAGLRSTFERLLPKGD